MLIFSKYVVCFLFLLNKNNKYLVEQEGAYLYSVNNKIVEKGPGRLRLYLPLDFKFLDPKNYAK